MQPGNPLVKAGPQCRQFLATQRISADGPGTILRDVRTLVDCIGTEGIRTKSKQGNLPAALLPAINSRLSEPIEHHLTRPLLRDYPNIAGVFIVLRVLELVRAEGSRLRVDPDQLAAWNGLNPAEQYFALLETWLLDADGQVLGGERPFFEEDFASSLLFLAATVSARWKTFHETVHRYGFGSGGPVSTWNTQLMMRLGLIEVKPRPLDRRSRLCLSQGWMMWRARRTPWGEAVAWAILDHLGATADVSDADLLCLSPPEQDEPGVFRPVFQPFFPEYQKAFAPPTPTARPGVYIFKVGFHRRYGPPDVWRRLAVPHRATLYDLAAEILKAFKFWDDDHLHEFRYRDRTGQSRVYRHSCTDEGPFSDEITVGETDLPGGQTIDFKFDFGSTWRFVLRLERVEPEDPVLRRPRVIESVGTPPPQYEGMDVE